MKITIMNAVYDSEFKFVPIGPLYIAAALEQAGYDVGFKDYQIYVKDNHFDLDRFLAFLEDSGPLIGIGCYADLLPLVILAVRELKKKFPDKIVILGGEGPSGVAEEILEYFPFIDFIVKGEGDETITRLINCIETGKDPHTVAGIAFRQDDRVHTTEPRPLMANLDNLPVPAYHKIDFNDYTIIGLVTSRGCPFKCTFCDVAAFWNYRSRPRSLDHLLNEIKILQEYGQQTIIFYDELFIVNRGRVLEFCRKLKEQSPGLRWSCLARADSMDEELMKELAGSGCFMISYGIESGSPNVQQKTHKNLTRESIEKTIALSVKYFEYVQTFFMWGFPFETMDDFYETIDLIDVTTKMGAVPDVNFLAPMPLSPLYKENKESLEFSKKLYLDTHPHIPAHHPVVDLIASYPTVFPSYYVWNPGLMAEKFAVARKFNIHMPLIR